MDASWRAGGLGLRKLKQARAPADRAMNPAQHPARFDKIGRLQVEQLVPEIAKRWVADELHNRKIERRPVTPETNQKNIRHQAAIAHASKRRAGVTFDQESAVFLEHARERAPKDHSLPVGWSDLMDDMVRSCREG